MPLFAKIMSFFCVLAAGAFLCLASLDWLARQPWAYEVWRAEFMVHGLPLDDRDTGWTVDWSQEQDLSDDTANEMFEKAGKKAVKTQKKEIENVRKNIEEGIDGLQDDTAKRQALRGYLLPQAHTFEERQALALRTDNDPEEIKKKMEMGDTDAQRTRLRALLPAMALTVKERDDMNNLVKDKEVPADKLLAALNDLASTASLKKLLGSMFDDAMPKDGEQEQVARQTRRAQVAHLLYNLSRDLAAHQRVMLVVGLRAYVNEAESQAAALREIAQRTRLAMINERTIFEQDYARQRQRLEGLAQDRERKKIELQEKEDLKMRNDALVKGRREEKDFWVKNVDNAKKETEASLNKQAELENQLFAVLKELGDIKDRNELLEGQIRALTARGGRR